MTLFNCLKPIEYKISGGLGNALLSFMIKSIYCNVKPTVYWNCAHTKNRLLLDKYTGPNEIDSLDNVLTYIITDYDMDRLIRNLNTERKRILRYLKFTPNKYNGVAALHLRLGDFTKYSYYYIPTKEFITEAIQKLPDNIHTILVFSNGTKEQVEDLTSVIPDKYKIEYDNTTEELPDVVLDRMGSCQAMIRTGSTLSFCAALLGNIDTVISSSQNTVWSEHLTLDLPGWQTIMV